MGALADKLASKTSMFGKTYNTVGSSDSNFIIKTKGDLKIQWGNKYIDLIKNGKVVSENSSIIQTAASQEEISSDGIYLITDENGDTQVWLSSSGTKIQLSSQSQETTFVSFMVEQEVTSNQQKQALRNIGFYYDSLQELQSAKVAAGIFYVLGEQKLYIAKDGLVSEYLNSTTVGTSSDKQPLYIQDYSLYADGSEYIKCNDKVFILKQLELYNGLQSNGATDLKGYRLYIDKEGRSILDIDIINERNYALDEVVYIYSEHVNYILSSKDSQPSQETGEVITTYTLRFPNKFAVDDTIFVLAQNSLSDSYNEDTKTLVLTLSEPVSSDFYVTIIQEGKEPIKQLFEKNITEKTIENIDSNYQLEYALNSALHEYKVVASNEQTIQLDTNKSLLGYIYKSNAPFIRIENNLFEVLDRSVLVEEENSETGEIKQVPDGTIHTKIGPLKEEEISSLTQCPTEESEITKLQNYENNIQVGIYSDNFIGLNSKLYNPIFKKRCEGQYPKYDKALTIPEEDWLNEKYYQVVPNIEWIKQLLDMAIPKGTIVMWSGATIPNGWAICDGTNGTPNLVGKFIKASDTAGDTGGNNSITLTEANLPNHTHNISENTTLENGSNKHTHTVPSQSNDTSEVSITDSTFTWKTVPDSETLNEMTDITTVKGLSLKSLTTGDSYLDSTSSSSTHLHSTSIQESSTSEVTEDSHQHTISQHTTSETPNAKNEAFNIQPEYYSLIFIIKV